ncbi:glycosyltransferase [Methanobacterium alcaliphilum]|uniref:glycosyltransferase n=1 Tax=Methanobacterium alcaliphilum TaxID=392018 RepID=UPI00200A0B02|nr:glycosyltransferase [Methanobacterium alcaliphilum]MCK9151775.1 glycosyltransferase [Methanobacterium alcaliphilum]
MPISIIIPMFNEEENVIRTIKTLQDILQNYDYEILIIDDGSSDKTYKIANDYAQNNNNIHVYKHKINIGRGRALRTGFENAEGDIFVTLDADLSFDPIFIPKMIDELLNDQTLDIVIGSQYMKGGITEGIPFHRLFISKAANKIVGFALKENLNTVTGVFRAYRKEVFDYLDLQSEDKEIHLEIISKSSSIGLNIKEIPVILRNREYGKSKMKFRSTTISHLLFTFQEKPMILFGMVGFLMILIGFLSGLYLIFEFLTGTLNPTRPLMIFTALLLLSGIQILIFGFVSTQIALIKKEVYLIQKELKLIKNKLDK